MNIPQSAIRPFEPLGIPALNACVPIISLANEVSDGMTRDIMNGYSNTLVLVRAELRAKSLGATYIRSGMSQGSHGIDFNVVCRARHSPITRRCRAFKAN